jgi:hypothetical protein
LWFRIPRALCGRRVVPQRWQRRVSSTQQRHSSRRDRAHSSSDRLPAPAMELHRVSWAKGSRQAPFRPRRTRCRPRTRTAPGAQPPGPARQSGQKADCSSARALKISSILGQFTAREGGARCPLALLGHLLWGYLDPGPAAFRLSASRRVAVIGATAPDFRL